MMTKDEILARTNAGLDVFRHYLPVPFRLGKNFRNPLYDDKRASCNMYFDKRKGCYRIKDFGNDDYSGDCFFFVGKLLHLDCKLSDHFKEIMRIITSDLCLSSRPQALPQRQVLPPQETVIVTDFQHHEIPFSKHQLAWWAQYGIDEKTLHRYGVKALSSFDSSNREGKPFRLYGSDADPLFAYLNSRHIKIYRPFSRFRFLQAGDIPNPYCFGWKQLPRKGDLLFITGGEKDVMCLASHNFSAIAFNSESSQIPKNLIRKLSFRFRHIALLFDADETGLKSAAKQTELLAEFRVINLKLPLVGSKQEKDVSDYFRLGNTAADLRLLFTQKLDAMYEENLELLQFCEVDLKHPPPLTRAIIATHGTAIASEGNLLCITGSEGSGKSNYIAALLAGCIVSEKNEVDCLGMNVAPNVRGQAVLMYDTEQSEVQLFGNVQRMLQRAQRELLPEFFHAFSLSSIPRKTRLDCIEQSMDKFFYLHGGIQLVVIDGIADLISSANDEGESTLLVERLHRMASSYNTCIITVLHFVPNGIKLR
ncbi:MAG: AAA family ATPase, partial [Mangrovibacterium sp.]